MSDLLKELAEQASECTRCSLCHSRTNSVFSSGSATSKLMMIGEAPGEDEDEQGAPFVGMSGQLLNKMIEKCLPMKRDDIYVANIVKCRPPGNRRPDEREIAHCFGFLQQQIMLVRPTVIITLGAVATQTLLQTSEPIGKMRGKVFDYNGISVVPTWHPSYLLRKASARWDSVDDMAVVTQLLNTGRVANTEKQPEA